MEDAYYVPDPSSTTSAFAGVCDGIDSSTNVAGVGLRSSRGTCSQRESAGHRFGNTARLNASQPGGSNSGYRALHICCHGLRFDL